jgi:hypothetical protein
MNLLGMKRKMLPYGMPLGGGGAIGGGTSSAAPSSSSGGKSAPIAQNNYGSSYSGGQSQSSTPSQGMMGGKSSGMGQGGYGQAPGFQQTAQAQPSFASNPYGGAPDRSFNTTTQQDMMGNRNSNPMSLGQTMQGLRGGKSSGLGQGGYGGAPGFNGQQQGLMGMGGFGQPQYRTMDQPFGGQPNQADAQFTADMGHPVYQDQPQQGMSPVQMQEQQRYQQGMAAGNPYAGTGGPSAPMPQQAMGAAAAQRQMQGGFGPQAQDTSEQAYNMHMATAMYQGTPPSYEQWKQQTTNSHNNVMQQMQGMLGGMGGGYGQQPQFNPYGGDFGTTGGFGGDLGSQTRLGRMGGMGGLNQPQRGFDYRQYQQEQQMNQMRNQYQQQQQRQQFNPYGGGYGQQGISGLQGAYNNMMGQYQQPAQQMPQYGMQGGQRGYRPDFMRAQENLNRVNPSVQKQQQDTQAARIADLEAQLAKYNTTNTNDSRD